MGETAIVVGDRKELSYLLSQAAELEHGLMCELAGFAGGLHPPVGADKVASVAGALRRAAATMTAYIETA